MMMIDMMMTGSWFAVVGPATLIAVLVAVHAIYFHVYFRLDTRYVIPADPERDDARSAGTGHFDLLDIPSRELPAGKQHGRRSGVARPEAPTIVARRIFGHDCGRIDVQAIHATECLDLAARGLRSQTLIVGGAARLHLGEISVSRLSSPDLTLQRHGVAGDSCRRAPPAPSIDSHDRDATPLVVMRSSVIQPGAVVTRPMIVYGDMDVGVDAVITTSIKVHGNLRLGQNVTVTAPMVANGDIHCGTECLFTSDLVAKGTLVVRHGTRFGLVGKTLVTVIGRRIRLSDRHEIAGSIMSSLPFEVQYGV